MNSLLDVMPTGLIASIALDAPIVNGLIPLTGTFKSDRLSGTEIAEAIAGDATEDMGSTRQSGNDQIWANGGSDQVYGDTSARLIEQARGGNDRIWGGTGNDTIFGDAQFITGLARGGNDRIWGGTGNDTINGDASALFDKATGGHDHLFGDDGNDTLRGDAGQLNGSAKGGNDTLSGGAGDDFIFGDSTFMVDNTQGGHDLLIGGEGNDALFGDSSPLRTRTGGDDILIGVDPRSRRPGRGEVDNLTGNGGRDRFVLGDAQTAYYVGQGDVDHGIIQDFRFAENDIIQLHGSASDYQLQDFSLGSVTGVDIFLSGTNELIGSVLGVSTATLNLNTAAFDFVG